MKLFKLLSIYFFMITPGLIFGQTSEDTLIFNLKDSKLFKVADFADFSHSTTYTPENLKATLKPSFRIKKESQLGITIRPFFANSSTIGVTLMGYIGSSENSPKEDILQIGQHDFDDDGINEFVFAHGKRGYYLICYIYKYHEPANDADAFRNENWNLIGEFEYYSHDPKYISVVEDSKIYFPVGSQGVSAAFIYVEGKFMEF